MIKMSTLTARIAQMRKGFLGGLLGGLLTGVILAGAAGISVEAQAPFSAQIQAALRVFLTQVHTWTGVQTTTLTGLGVISTDGLVLQNTTLSTAVTSAQISPRVKGCGTAYNSVSTLSETDCMFWEVLPATVAGTTTQTWRLGSIINGGAATYPLTVDNSGTLSLGVANALSGTLVIYGASGSHTATLVTNGTNSVTLVAGTAGALPLKLAATFISNGINGSPWIGTATPTVTSAGTSPTVPNSNGTAAFRINVGTGGTATTIVLGLPLAQTGWNCFGTNLTGAAANRAAGVIVQQSSTTTAATLQYQTLSTGVALAFTASDIVAINCMAF